MSIENKGDMAISDSQALFLDSEFVNVWVDDSYSPFEDVPETPWSEVPFIDWYLTNCKVVKKNHPFVSSSDSNSYETFKTLKASIVPNMQLHLDN